MWQSALRRVRDPKAFRTRTAIQLTSVQRHGTPQPYPHGSGPTERRSAPCVQSSGLSKDRAWGSYEDMCLTATCGRPGRSLRRSRLYCVSVPGLNTVIYAYLTCVFRHLLKESLAIAESLPYAGGYLARGSYRLAQTLAALHEPQQSQVYLEAAYAARESLLRDVKPPLDTRDGIEAFDTLVPWMLW